MGKAIDELKEKPKEERVAVASSIALIVVVALFVGWSFFFLKKTLRSTPAETAWGPQQDVIDFSTVQEATESFSATYFDVKKELQQIRDEVAAEQARADAENTFDTGTTYYTQGESSAPDFSNF